MVPSAQAVAGLTIVTHRGPDVGDRGDLSAHLGEGDELVGFDLPELGCIHRASASTPTISRVCDSI
jgi:hypothetical protein